MRKQKDELMAALENLNALDEKTKKQTIKQLAACIGPGIKGQRIELNPTEAKSAARAIREAWIEAEMGVVPAFLIAMVKDEKPTYKDRKAKLFEVGEYNDKNLHVTRANLKTLETTFDFPVPILVEHIETPMRLGYLTDVKAVGTELFGVLSLTPKGDELVEKTGARSLSVSVDKNLNRIFEVSIVANPRIQSAKLFCGNFRPVTQRERFYKTESERLQREIKNFENRDIIESLIRSGQLAPVCRKTAMNMLEKSRETGCSREFVDFINSLPKTVIFGELAPNLQKTLPLSTEETQFYAKCFPDIAIEEIMKRKVKECPH